jgi:arylsulfatase A-like enzyme
LPTATKLIFAPDILRGDDAYNHLPGILKRAGYSTASFTLRHYADAYDFNLRGGFDQSNGRKESRRGSSLLFTAAGQDGGFLLETMQDRIVGRILHLAGEAGLDNAFEQVTDGTEFTDPERLDQLLRFMKDADRPFLAHVHLLATHGPRFPTRKREFSRGLKQDEIWMDDFYDDAILYVDAAFGTILKDLQKSGLLENTLVVLYSDHGSRFSGYHATPLLFRFPHAEHRGEVTGTSQNIDIAPTILDYLGLEIPGSMSGTSLLSDPPRTGEARPVFGVHRGRHRVKRNGLWEMDQNQTGPPFYSLGYPSMVVCGEVYCLDLEAQLLYIFDAEGSTASCEPPSPEEAEAMLLRHLEDNGYDLSAMNPPFDRVFREPEREDTGVQ